MGLQVSLGQGNHIERQILKCKSFVSNWESICVHSSNLEGRIMWQLVLLFPSAISSVSMYSSHNSIAPFAATSPDGWERTNYWRYGISIAFCLGAGDSPVFISAGRFSPGFLGVGVFAWPALGKDFKKAALFSGSVARLVLEGAAAAVRGDIDCCLARLFKALKRSCCGLLPWCW